jgi:hypothetical protein
MAREVIELNQKKSSGIKIPTPWIYDEKNSTIVSIPTGEVVFELNISPLRSFDKSNIVGMLAALNASTAKVA